MTSKDIFEFTLTLLRAKGVFDKDKGVSAHKKILIEEFSYFEKALELGKLYKEFFDALKPNVYKFVVDDYESPEYLDFEAEDTTKCLDIFNKIKEIENE